MEHLLILSLVFLAVSTLFAMLGMGGGILYVPILLFAGFNFRDAPTISLVLIIATSFAALSTFIRNKKVDWKLAFVIDPPTDIMAFVGGYYSSLLSESLLQSILAVVLLVAGILMFKNKLSSSSTHQFTQKKWWLWHREFNGNSYSLNLPLVLVATASIGVLSGMLGITGGLIKLPIMVLLCGVPMDIAVATSTVMVAVTALSGLAGHAINSQINWKVAILLAITAVIGGLIGSHISVSIDKVKLKKIFAVIIWLIAIHILYGLLS